jgi:hypothetical protein
MSIQEIFVVVLVGLVLFFIASLINPNNRSNAAVSPVYHQPSPIDSFFGFAYAMLLGAFIASCFWLYFMLTNH